MQPGPPALGVQSLSHWTTREVPKLPLFSFIKFYSFLHKSLTHFFFNTLGHDFLSYFEWLSFISFSNYWLLIYRNTINFYTDFVSTAPFGYKLILYSQVILYFVIIMSSLNNDSFVSSFPILIILISFSYLMALTGSQLKF